MGKKPKTESETAAETAYEEALALAPAGLEGKNATEAAIIRWVARNIDNPLPSPVDCPDPFAWTLLRQCRANPAFQLTFIEKLWAKLIPSRATLEDGGEDEFDGRVTVAIIDKIRSFGKPEIEEDGAEEAEEEVTAIPDYFASFGGGGEL